MLFSDHYACWVVGYAYVVDVGRSILDWRCQSETHNSYLPTNLTGCVVLHTYNVMCSALSAFQESEACQGDNLSFETKNSYCIIDELGRH